MKQIVLGIILVFGMGLSANSQVVHKHALGGRIGAGAYFGPELSYQMGITDRNRFEFDLGGRFHPFWTRFAFTTCFHWDFNILSGWNWFIGPGVQIASYIDHNDKGNNAFPVALGAQAGMEFDFNVFDVPVVAGVDIRPMFDLYGVPFVYHPALALSARYTFTK